MAKPLKLSEKKLIAMTPEMVEAIKEYRFSNRIDAESEAVRRLIHTGLAARPILIDIQKMLVAMRPLGGESELDEHIEAIQQALNAE